MNEPRFTREKPILYYITARERPHIQGSRSARDASDYAKEILHTAADFAQRIRRPIVVCADMVGGSDDQPHVIRFYEIDSHGVIGDRLPLPGERLDGRVARLAAEAMRLAISQGLFPREIRYTDRRAVDAMLSEIEDALPRLRGRTADEDRQIWRGAIKDIRSEILANHHRDTLK